jgi:hypothetical protein
VVQPDFTVPASVADGSCLSDIPHVSAVFLRDSPVVVLRSQRMDRFWLQTGGATEVAVEAPLTICPDGTALSVRQGGSHDAARVRGADVAAVCSR